MIRLTTPIETPEALHGSGRSRARAAGTPHRFGHRVGHSCRQKPYTGYEPSRGAAIHASRKNSKTGPAVAEPAGERSGLPLGGEEFDPSAGPDAAEPGRPTTSAPTPRPCRGLRGHLRLGDRPNVPRHPEGVKCLRPVEKAGPKNPVIPLILDHYAPPAPQVLDWIERQKRLFRPFTPTSASGLNRIERCLGPRTEKRLRRGVFHSVPDLERSLQDYLKTYNENPRPLVWTKTADEILQKVGRSRPALAAASA